MTPSPTPSWNLGSANAPTFSSFGRTKMLYDPSKEYKVESVLPDTPSALIRLALADLEKIEQSPHHKVNMKVWHDAAGRVSSSLDPTLSAAYGDGRCQTCFAGAVLAMSLNTDPGEFLNVCAVRKRYGGKVADSMLALDAFRMGDVWSGLHYLDKYDPRAPRYWSVSTYETVYGGAVLFKADMTLLVDKLESLGL